MSGYAWSFAPKSSRMVLAYSWAMRLESTHQQNHWTKPLDRWAHARTARRLAMKTSRKFGLPLLALATASIASRAENPPGLEGSRVFSYQQRAPKVAANGSVGRFVLGGRLTTGETVSVHETLQPAGTVPNPAHRIGHSEVIVVERGWLEFDHDGKAGRAGPGSIIFVALGTVHRIKNVSRGPAQICRDPNWRRHKRIAGSVVRQILLIRPASKIRALTRPFNTSSQALESMELLWEGEEEIVACV
jgi:quercetin dioxygenase-like cupin family protein